MHTIIYAVVELRHENDTKHQLNDVIRPSLSCVRGIGLRYFHSVHCVLCTVHAIKVYSNKYMFIKTCRWKRVMWSTLKQETRSEKKEKKKKKKNVEVPCGCVDAMTENCDIKNKTFLFASAALFPNDHLTLVLCITPINLIHIEYWTKWFD